MVRARRVKQFEDMECSENVVFQRLEGIGFQGCNVLHRGRMENDLRRIGREYFFQLRLVKNVCVKKLDSGQSESPLFVFAVKAKQVLLRMVKQDESAVKSSH